MKQEPRPSKLVWSSAPPGAHIVTVAPSIVALVPHLPLGEIDVPEQSVAILVHVLEVVRYRAAQWDLRVVRGDSLAQQATKQQEGCTLGQHVFEGTECAAVGYLAIKRDGESEETLRCFAQSHVHASASIIQPSASKTG